ncbi:MAG: hypothetical protein KF833_18465 [Verrucomicrobiae bacterium]|nr:hypothetical protein [Verrucomicrobiae bacterium]
MNPTHSSLRSLITVISPSVLALAVATPTEALAQGCVAIRSVGSPALPGLAGLDEGIPWVASISYRYFESDRYFMGTQELSVRDHRKSETDRRRG